METNKPATLCWKCANACGKCSWSDGSFTPVEGWVAEPTKLHGYRGDGGVIDSFRVIECPLYEDDTQQYNRKVKRNKWNSAPYLQEVTA